MEEGLDYAFAVSVVFFFWPRKVLIGRLLSVSISLTSTLGLFYFCLLHCVSFKPALNHPPSLQKQESPYLYTRKRDLVQRQQRPSMEAKETQYSGKRDLLLLAYLRSEASEEIGLLTLQRKT